MSPKTISESSATPVAAGPSNGARRVKGKRTRTGCLTCRARKVKCDEAPGTCANCERVLLACRWPVVRNVLDERAAAHSSSSIVKSEPDGHSPGPIRRNRQAACVACRIARCRCSQDRPACARCVEHGTACEYTSDRSGPGTGRTPSSTEVSPNDPEHDRRGNQLHGIPRSVIDRHVEAFFAYVYPIQANAIVHRGTLMREITDGRVARKVLLAICAAAARFVDHMQASGAPVAVRGSMAAKAWATEAKTTLLTEDPSLDSITAALILAKEDISSGRFSQAFTLAAVAMRMALAMRLHQELPPDDEKSISERETRRRLMWGCFSLDRMMSTGVPEFLITPVQSLRIRLPCDDQRYLYGMAVETPIPALESAGDSNDRDPAKFEGVGILGHHLRLQGVRTMILYVSRNREPSDLPPWDPSGAFVAAERKIQAWYDSLSPQFHLTPETVYARKAQNELTPLIMIHIWYHMNLVELYRMAMPGFPESLEPAISSTAPHGWTDRNRDQCVHHARMIANTLRHVSSLVDLDTMIFGDSSLPICVYESVRARLQYAFLLPLAPQAAELAELAADVEVMFSFLMRMSRYFSNARWLLRETRRMLQRHGLDGSAHSDTSGAASPNGADPWSSRVRRLRDQPPRPQPQSNQLLSAPGPSNTHLPAPNSSQHQSQMMPPAPQHSPGLMPSASQTNHHVMYNDPQPFVDWSNHGVSQDSQDDVMALLNEYSQNQNTGMGGGFSSFMGMFGDWVAIGYDGGPVQIVDPPLQV